jgi:hypothetical protein
VGAWYYLSSLPVFLIQKLVIASRYYSRTADTPPASNRPDPSPEQSQSAVRAAIQTLYHNPGVYGIVLFSLSARLDYRVEYTIRLYGILSGNLSKFNALRLIFIDINRFICYDLLALDGHQLKFHICFRAHILVLL